MPPLWYDAGSFSLHVYSRETHQRPHLAVRHGPRALGTVDIETGKVLAGTIPPATLRKIRVLLAAHRQEALSAFNSALAMEPVDRLQIKKGEQ